MCDKEYEEVQLHQLASGRSVGGVSWRGQGETYGENTNDHNPQNASQNDTCWGLLQSVQSGKWERHKEV